MSKRILHTSLAFAGFTSLLTGCTGMPGEGPAAFDVELQQIAKGVYIEDANRGKKVRALDYVIVDLDETAVDKINLYFPQHFSSPLKTIFGSGHSGRIGVGDQLSVGVWEASGDGLFSTTDKKQTSVLVTVDQNGNIFIPFVGYIRAAGKSVEQLRKTIQDGLEGKAVEPQVLVTMQQNVSNSVVVVGDVNHPSKYPLPVQGLRLLEAIASASGTKEATFESVVTITRGKKSATIRLDDVMNQPENNIALSPNDYILVVHQPRTFSSFGAVSKSQLVPFKMEKLSLAEALAQVGGLKDREADRGGVFLLRYEDTSLTKWLVENGIGTGNYSVYAGSPVPVIYRLNMNKAKSFFTARNFAMRDKDVLYVANHPTAEFGKFLSMIVSPITGTARTVVSIAD